MKYHIRPKYYESLNSVDIKFKPQSTKFNYCRGTNDKKEIISDNSIEFRITNEVFPTFTNLNFEKKDKTYIKARNYLDELFDKDPKSKLIFLNKETMTYSLPKCIRVIVTPFPDLDFVNETISIDTDRYDISVTIRAAIAEKTFNNMMQSLSSRSSKKTDVEIDLTLNLKTPLYKDTNISDDLLILPHCNDDEEVLSIYWLDINILQPF